MNNNTTLIVKVDNTPSDSIIQTLVLTVILPFVVSTIALFLQRRFEKIEERKSDRFKGYYSKLDALWRLYLLLDNHLNITSRLFKDTVITVSGDVPPVRAITDEVLNKKITDNLTDLKTVIAEQMSIIEPDDEIFDILVSLNRYVCLYDTDKEYVSKQIVPREFILTRLKEIINKIREN